MIRPGGGLMEERSHTVATLKAKVDQGAYRVDATAVADALLAHMRGQRRARWERLLDASDSIPYSECSNPPDGWTAASVKTSPDAPGRTLPTQVSPRSRFRTAISAIVRALSGTQTQSS